LSNKPTQILVAPADFQETIKKSRFIARARPLGEVEAAASAIEALSEKDARHNCWAFRYGQTYRFYDAGEPSGTAGHPILAAIDGKCVDQVLVVVIRYFGGIKLGAGGLVRAYGGVAAKCLDGACLKPQIARVEAYLEIPFAHTGPAYQVLSRFATEQRSLTYTHTGVRMTVSVPSAELDDLLARLSEASAGTIGLAAPPSTQDPGGNHTST